MILVWFTQSNCLNICFPLKENDLDNQLGHQTSSSPWNTVIKGQWDLSNSSVPDIFDLRSETPPLSTETTDEEENIITAKCQSDMVCNGNIHSIQMRSSTDHHFSMNGDWFMVSH